MYSNIHGVTGALIVSGVAEATGGDPTAVALSVVAAFLSHDVLDRLGEKSYGNMATTLWWEGVPLLVFMILAYLSDQWWLYAIGFIAGTGMDLIDKKLGLAIMFRDRFSFGHYFRCHRRQPDINLTLGQTRFATIFATVLLIVVSVYLNGSFNDLP